VAGIFQFTLLNKAFTLHLFRKRLYFAKNLQKQPLLCLFWLKIMKGIPWTPQEEAQLKALVEGKTSIATIAKTLKRTPTAILVKCERMGLEPSDRLTQTTLPLPEELPSMEETLKELAAALRAAKEPGLNKVEVQRLQAIATLARTYKELLIDYLNIREVEARLNDMEAKYASLLETKSQNPAPQPVPTELAKTPSQ
jgi:hypothetical protein